MAVQALSFILQDILTIPAIADKPISGLSLDSRYVQSGDLFFAYPGYQLDGRKFIDDALAKGAHAVLVEADTQNEGGVSWHNDIPIISVKALRSKLGIIAANFYGHPGKLMRMVGITGTNGKTSCSQFIASALQHLGYPCGVVGTLGIGMYGHLDGGSLTTPDPLVLQAAFVKLLGLGAKAVAMEVSSHSLDQDRTLGIPFEIGVFTNLSRDHLDYHETMESYAAAKKRLFHNYDLRHAVINADDKIGEELLAELSAKNNVIAYSIQSTPYKNIPTVYVTSPRITMNGISAHIHTPWGEGMLKTKLIGQFNLSNILATTATLCLLGFSLAEVLASVAELTTVPGRMQTFGGLNKPLVVVDYAHKPDALEKVLLALKQHCQGQLYCLMGCGGDRDKGKRPMMAKIAEHYADRVWVTNDNPRFEDPQQIVADIMQGFNEPNNVKIEYDRSKAIQDIIQCAKAGDCVLIAGKGAETYQQIGAIKRPFSDIEEVQRWIKN